MLGRHHARVLHQLDGVDLVAVAAAAGEPHHVAGPLEVLPDVHTPVAAAIDYAMVAAPPRFHTETGLALAEAGVHTLIEKPLASDTAGAQRLADAFEAAGLVGAVGHIERYNPALQSLRARLEAGEDRKSVVEGKTGA